TSTHEKRSTMASSTRSPQSRTRQVQAPEFHSSISVTNRECECRRKSAFPRVLTPDVTTVTKVVRQRPGGSGRESSRSVAFTHLISPRLHAEHVPPLGVVLYR